MDVSAASRDNILKIYLFIFYRGHFVVCSDLILPLSMLPRSFLSTNKLECIPTGDHGTEFQKI